MAAERGAVHTKLLQCPLRFSGVDGRQDTALGLLPNCQDVGRGGGARPAPFFRTLSLSPLTAQIHDSCLCLVLGRFCKPPLDMGYLSEAWVVGVLVRTDFLSGFATQMKRALVPDHVVSCSSQRSLLWRIEACDDDDRNAEKTPVSIAHACFCLSA